MDKCANDSNYSGDLVNLAAQCVKELFNVELNSKSKSISIIQAFKIERDMYHGPYGWNDETGKSLSTADLEKPNMKNYNSSQINEIILHHPAGENDDVTEKLNLIIPNVERPQKLLIEEISSNKNSAVIIPVHCLKEVDGSTYKLTVELPGIKSAKDIKIIPKPQSKLIEISYKEMKLDYQLPDDSDITIIEAKLVKSRLKLKFKKCELKIE